MAAEVKPDAVIVAQARLMDFTLETLEALGVPSYEETYSAARQAFPGVALGGGVLTNFTELNRNHPTPDLYDFISHLTSAVVHEVDDRSVTETLQSLPSLIGSVRAMAKKSRPRSRRIPPWSGALRSKWVTIFATTASPPSWKILNNV